MNIIKNYLVLILLSSISSVVFAQNTVLTAKNCSGQIADLNCYPEVFSERSQASNYGKAPANMAYYQGQKIIVDTYDTEACEVVKRDLQTVSLKKTGHSIDVRDLCDVDESSSNRFKSITLMWETDEIYATAIKHDLLTSADKNLATDTRNLAYMMAGTLGLLWLAPESITKWDKNSASGKSLWGKWKDNVSNGPVMDKDDPLINYVGHPVSGAVYYNIARNNGASKMQSFGYSVIMSTFFWEYGFEAFAEKPSIQDLIITPVVGSILGEVFYQYSQKIKANGGTVMGSKRLGKVMLFVLNPAGEISDQINKFMGSRVVQEGKAELVLSRKKSDFFGRQSNYIGIQFNFNFY